MTKRILAWIFPLAVFLVIVGLTVLAFRQKNIRNNDKSIDRLQDLSNVFRSKLGDFWPYTLAFVSCIILVCFSLLFTKIRIRIKDSVFERDSLIFYSIVGVTVVGLAADTFLESNNPVSPNYTGESADDEQKKQILMIIGIVVGFIVLIVVLIKVLQKLRSQLNSQKTTQLQTSDSAP